MKLDKIAFANVIAYIGNIVQRQNIDAHDITVLDQMIDIDVPVQDNPRVSEHAVCELLNQLNKDDGFIPAIKAYRSLTGANLKEAKEAIEKHRESTISGKFFAKHQLMAKLKAEKIEDDAQYYAVERFIESLFK